MKTINRIIKQSGYSKKEMTVYKKMGVCNGLGGKGGVNFSEILKKLPGFDSKKGKQLLKDMNIVSCLHDMDYYLSKGFISSNYRFCCNITQLFHWSTAMARFLLFTVLFIGLNIFGIRYYYKWTLKTNGH